MTALTYIDNNSTFRYVVSTGVDGAGGGICQMWRNYWGSAGCDSLWQGGVRG